MVIGLLNRLRHWALAVSVRGKILGMVASLVLFLGLAITLQTHVSLQGSLRHQLEERCLALSRSLAAQSTDYLLTNNTFPLYELVRTTMENDEDVRYLFILDPQGNPVVHSFPDGFPQDLLEVNPVAPGQDHALETLDTEEGLIHDQAVPILGGRVGVAHVGMSEKSLEAAVGDAVTRVLSITAFALVVGMVIAYIVTTLITRPISELVGVTEEISRGNLGCKASLWAEDEIGQLGIAFNSMTEDLRESRDELEGTNRELRRRNRELAALNAIAAVASRTSDLDRVFACALSKALEILDIPLGSIFLLDEYERLSMVANIGPSEGIATRQDNPFPFGCLRSQFMMEKALVLSCNPEGCDQAQQQPACLVEGIVAYAIIPLQSKARVIGLMNVGSGEERHFTAKDMKFLESVGVQIGVAIENTELWDELKDKEELRGQLLERVITAQEEERKRIARELHDQTGQALTSLLVSLKVIEKAGDLEQARELTSDMRAIVTETLDDVHNLSLELRPSVLDDMGLVPALARYVESCPARFGLQVDFVIAGMDRQRLPMEVETTLYRIAQEALTNVARHSKAGHASVLLERRRRAAVLVIEDDGEGFDTAQVLRSPAERERLGLYGMMERASLVGGQLTVESRPGAGTTVSVEVPLEELWLEDHGVRAG